ncbi:IclR family transcriptional regulator [Kocuria turfanensis]|uniref:Glycerol operon regulatory protein n=1 Tax=Kocuria turfanensis TaxID=388357 RepID=A0A512IEN5_9MICC|nr:IclR family transcriptional regulator [Kocuria turfanensis]GEO96150.1 IclR family transcriptional regulator [Kocuria turfanensis]
MSSSDPRPLIASDASKEQTTTDGVTPGGVQSVDRAITVLEVLARTGGSTVTEVAAELGVHKSTASRLLGALEARGLVHHPSDGSRYELGFGILRLAHAIPGRLSVVAEARDEIRRLARTHSETVNLAVLREGQAVNVDQEMGPSSIATHDWIGSLTPLHATASGKVLLAGLSSDERARVLRTRGLPALTARTITSRKQLERQLIDVAAQGYATVCEEFEIGLNSVAVPVRDHLGTVIASISVSGPAFRFTEEKMTDLVEELREAGERVSGRMGYVPVDKPE